MLYGNILVPDAFCHVGYWVVNWKSGTRRRARDVSVSPVARNSYFSLSLFFFFFLVRALFLCALIAKGGSSEIIRSVYSELVLVRFDRSVECETRPTNPNGPIRFTTGITLNVYRFSLDQVQPRIRHLVFLLLLLLLPDSLCASFVCSLRDRTSADTIVQLENARFDRVLLMIFHIFYPQWIYV